MLQDGGLLQLHEANAGVGLLSFLNKRFFSIHPGWPIQGCDGVEMTSFNMEFVG